MTIDYKKITLEELDKIIFFHMGFDFICDADRKVIILEKNGE